MITARPNQRHPAQQNPRLIARPAWGNGWRRGVWATDALQDELAGQPFPEQGSKNGQAGTCEDDLSPRRGGGNKEDKERGLNSPQCRGDGGGYRATLRRICIGGHKAKATPPQGQGTPLADEPDSDRLDWNGQLTYQQSPREGHEADGGGSDGWETEGQPPETVPDRIGGKR